MKRWFTLFTREVDMTEQQGTFENKAMERHMYSKEVKMLAVSDLQLNHEN